MTFRPNNALYRLDTIRRNLVRRIQQRVSRPAAHAASECNVTFVIASPRSGTTWLQRALNEHPEICCGENRLFGSHFDVLTDGDNSRLRITADEFIRSLAIRTPRQNLNVSVDRYADELTQSLSRVIFEKWREHSGKPILIDKVTPYPGTSQEVVKKIRRFFPQARVVHLVRDGRDVLTSGVFHWLQKSIPDGEPSPVARQRTALILDGQGGPLPRFFSDGEIDTWAKTWREPIDAVNASPFPHVLQIRYEDMVDDLSAVLLRICQFVDADSSDSLLAPCVRYSSFSRMSGGRQPGESDPAAHVRKGIAGDWKNYFTRQDGELYHGLCGDLLQKLDFDSDRTWIDSLPEFLRLRKAA